jgi:UDP-glucose 4-epimerase
VLIFRSYFKELQKMKILVTGGAGFIGSHLNDALLEKGNEVYCVDDLSLGSEENIRHLFDNKFFQFQRMDVTKGNELSDYIRDKGIQCIFHLAANSDIQQGAANPAIDLERTFMTTYKVLEAMRSNAVKDLVFSSTSAIYGEKNVAISEDEGPLQPISLYGAAKLCSESYISAYCHNFGIRAWICRFPNVVGDRSTHGVIYDFVRKLDRDPKRLEILGDGKQHKPYIYVKDLVTGILFCWENSSETLNVYNLGVDSETTVTEIAEIVVEEMGLNGANLAYTGGDRGWKGDVPFFAYDLSKVHALGWSASRTSNEAVRHSVRMFLADRKK